jgi:hypothetical protein
MRRFTRTVGGLLLFLFLASGAVEAQFAQYTTPGGPEGRPVDRKAQLKKQVESARLRLGPVRVAPTLGLKDVEYVRNLLGKGAGGTPTDFTGTVSAGARAYLPTGPAVTWTLYAVPEYVWWQRESGRRRLDGLYGLGFDGFWNRLTVTAAAGSDAQQQILTPEIPRLTSSRVDHAGGTAQLELSGPIYAYAAGTVSRYKSLGNPALDPLLVELAQLDREERVARVGLRWRRQGWYAGVGAEYSDVSFTDRRPGAIDLSNSGTAPVVELARDSGRLFFQADLAQRSLTAKQGSSFVKFSKPTGHASLSYELSHSVGLWVYVNRNLVYSLATGYSYSDDLRHGAAVHLRLGRRTAANLFAETGSLDYTAAVFNTPRRKDDLTSFGGALSFNLAHHLTLSLQGSRTRFTSNVSGASRELSVLGLTATFTGGQP